MARGAVDWPGILRRYGIEFITSGPNVKQSRGEINVRCPFCGPRDPSHHMGLHPSGVWACWRDSDHRGSAASYLLRHLLGVSREVARSLIGDEAAAPSPISDLRERVQSLGEEAGPVPLRPLRWPEEIKPLTRRDRFYDFLKRRGFPRPFDVAEFYDLRRAMTGDQAFRLVFPIRINGTLVGWTGRAIAKSKIRYKTHPSGEEAIGPRIIHNQEMARLGGRVLAVVEGPVDSTKLDYFGMRFGLRAVGLLGLNFTPGKIALLSELSEEFDAVALLLDPEAVKQAIAGRGALAFLRGRILSPALLGGFEDPGALSPEAAKRLAKRVCREV